MGGVTSVLKTNQTREADPTNRLLECVSLYYVYELYCGSTMMYGEQRGEASQTLKNMND